MSGRIQAQQTNKGEVSGKVTDKQSSTVLPFATIAIFDKTDELVEGGITDADGLFSLKVSFGSYYAMIEFMGYEAFKTDIFTLSRENPEFNLGVVGLESGLSNLDEVIVEGEKPFMELALDKRIFNVAEDLANAGRTTSDILMNLPSVTVDTDGNVR